MNNTTKKKKKVGSSVSRVEKKLSDDIKHFGKKK